MLFSSILAGYLYFLFDLGLGTTTVKTSHFRLDDGSTHQVSLLPSGGTGIIRVDDQERPYTLIEYTGLEPLDLEGGIYVGGIQITFALIYCTIIL